MESLYMRAGFDVLGEGVGNLIWILVDGRMVDSGIDSGSFGSPFCLLPLFAHIFLLTHILEYTLYSSSTSTRLLALVFMRLVFLLPCKCYRSLLPSAFISEHSYSTNIK